MNRLFSSAVLAAMMAVFLLASMPLSANSADGEADKEKPAAQAKAAPQGPPPTVVRLGLVGMRSVARTSPFVGMVDFEDVSELGPEVAGKVADILVREGDTVRRGDPLVTLDKGLKKKDAEAARNAAEEAEFKYRNLDTDLVRAEGLFNKGIISRQDYDNAMSARDQQKKKYESLTAQHEKLKLELEKMDVRAPYDGVVLEKHASVGDWLSVGEKAVTLASTGDVFVEVAVPEDIVRFVVVGKKVGLTLNALGKDVEGTVSGIVPVAEPRTRNFRIKVKVDYMPHMLKNMSANVHVPVSPPLELKIISRDALVNFQGKDFVYTVKDGKSVILPATIAAYLGGEVGVTDPFYVPGMPVVVEGNDRIMGPDMPLMIVNPEIIPKMPAQGAPGAGGKGGAGGAGASGKPEGGR